MTFKPFITFNDSSDTGINKISLNSYVQILSDDNNKHRLIFVKSMIGMTNANTVSSFLAGDSSNYVNILTDYNIG